jgi:hypothetical protein
MSLPYTETDELKVARTAHAMLVPWGVFARRIGLVQALEQVPVSQRTRVHTPQSKLVEFLVAHLSGCAHLQDISHGAHPLDQDQVVAEAWGQPAWADYSGVSRTLHACDQQTVDAVREATTQVSRPFIDQEVLLALRKTGVLVYDGDLTGRPVSSTSTTYEGAAFGWMDDAVCLGYQAALVSLDSPTYGRLWLSVRPHPGDTVSCHQMEAMVRTAESTTGVRPLRRTELLAERIRQKQEILQKAQERLQARQVRCHRAKQKMQETAIEWRRWLAEIARIVERDGSTQQAKRPYSQLTKTRKKVAVFWRRLHRRGAEVQRAHRAITRQAKKVEALHTEIDRLKGRYACFVEENRQNRAPIRAIFRLDGGFGSGENVAWLIEMGYEVYAKAFSTQVTRALRRRVTVDTAWMRVGDNAEMAAWPDLKLEFCPYPLDVGLEHFYTGQSERFATLLHYGSQDATEDLATWFDFYNGRQTIEAGVKEGKAVFEMHHLKVRSAVGLAIQEEFAVVAANLVRWAAVWLREQPSPPRAPFNRQPVSVKQMVRIAANTSALVFRQPEGNLLLRFDELSSFAGLELLIGQGKAFQLTLPLFRNEVFAPT